MFICVYIYIIKYHTLLLTDQHATTRNSCLRSHRSRSAVLTPLALLWRPRGNQLTDNWSVVLLLIETCCPLVLSGGCSRPSLFLSPYPLLPPSLARWGQQGEGLSSSVLVLLFVLMLFSLCSGVVVCVDVVLLCSGVLLIGCIGGMLFVLYSFPQCVGQMLSQGVQRGFVVVCVVLLPSVLLLSQGVQEDLLLLLLLLLLRCSIFRPIYSEATHVATHVTNKLKLTENPF